jgi:hypothetical protein
MFHVNYVAILKLWGRDKWWLCFQNKGVKSQNLRTRDKITIARSEKGIIIIAP